jgi:hypothetical protein
VVVWGVELDGGSEGGVGAEMTMNRLDGGRSRAGWNRGERREGGGGELIGMRLDGYEREREVVYCEGLGWWLAWLGGVWLRGEGLH